MDELDKALRGERRALGWPAPARGVRLAALASSPHRVQVTPSRGDRYERMHPEFGQVATMRNTCGMDVYVAVSDPAEGVRGDAPGRQDAESYCSAGHVPVAR